MKLPKSIMKLLRLFLFMEKHLYKTNPDRKVETTSITSDAKRTLNLTFT